MWETENRIHTYGNIKATNQQYKAMNVPYLYAKFIIVLILHTQKKPNKQYMLVHEINSKSNSGGGEE
jgi:hypothetical protein